MSDMIPILKALADKTRFRLLHLLLTHDLCVGAIAGHLKISKPAVSQHLQILRKAGLVKGEKRGYWTHYSVDRGVLRRIADELLKTADRGGTPTAAAYSPTPWACGTAPAERVEFQMYKGPCPQPEPLEGGAEGVAAQQVKGCPGCEKGRPRVSGKGGK